MIRIQLLGRFGLWRAGQIIHLKPQPLRELFCYLLVKRARDLSREMLASDLWGHRSTAQSLKTFRQALWQLSRLLLEHSISEIKLIDREFPKLELCPQVDLDIRQLERVSELLVEGSQLTSEGIAALKSAAELYRGDLLEGWDQDWCLLERERYHNLYIAALDTLVELCLERRDTYAGLHYAQRLLALEPARECTHRQMMELYLLSGDRTAALRQFDRCAALLKQEYSVTPCVATLEVYRVAREGRSSPAPQGLLLDHDVREEIASALKQILDTLKDMKRMLER